MFQLFLHTSTSQPAKTYLPPMILLVLLIATGRSTQATQRPFATNEQTSAAATSTFSSLLELHKEHHLNRIPVWETIDAIANSSSASQESDYWLALELAAAFDARVVAHGLAKKFIKRFGTTCSTETFFSRITPFSEKAQVVLRKEFFLMTGNPLVMTYTDNQGVTHTLTFLYDEIFYERQYLIDNAKLIFNNRFLSSLDGFEAPTIYYVDKADLSHNILTTLPESLATVPTINLVDLSYNQLVTVPEVISKLPALEILYLHHNQLTALTPSLGNLKRLYRLDVSHNQLKTLPINLDECTNLHWLTCAHNAIQQLPANIASVKSLERIDLSDNQLITLPVQLAELPALRYLNIKNNPSLRSIPAACKRIARLEKDDHVVFDEV